MDNSYFISCALKREKITMVNDAVCCVILNYFYKQNTARLNFRHAIEKLQGFQVFPLEKV